MERIRLPESVKIILDKLDSNGYEAYVVGGCVRDKLIGIAPHDWDICTSALPAQVLKIFDQYRVILTGLKHGTVTVVIDDKQYEITTYRIDGDYKDGRHPDRVSFTNSLGQDLSRRDFTINAMAYNPRSGLIDLFGGKDDIKNRVIRCVGNPDDRFQEDALRMMRATRFAATLDYTIDKDTRNSIFKNKELIKHVSFERINAEFIKAFSAGYNLDMIELLKVVVPELEQIDDVASNCKFMLSSNRLSFYSKVVLLFRFDAQRLKNVLKRLKFTNKAINDIVDIHKCVSDFDRIMFYTAPTTTVKKILNINEDVIYDVLGSLDVIAFIRHDYKMYEYVQRMYKVVESCKRECYRISQLEINGNDLIEMGYSGAEVGAALNSLVHSVIEGKVSNELSELRNLLNNARK